MELSSKQIEQFNKDGYIIFPELFTSDEIDICLLYTSDAADEP